MRTGAAAVVVLAAGFLLGGQAVRGVLVISLLVLVLVAVGLGVGRFSRRVNGGGTRGLWIASLLVSAVLVLASSLAAAHVQSNGARGFADLIMWALLTCIIRGVLALVSYLLREAHRVPDPTPSTTELEASREVTVDPSPSVLTASEPRSARKGWRRWLAPWPQPTGEARQWTPGYAIAALVLSQVLAVVVLVVLGLVFAVPGIIGAPVVECSLLVTMLPLCRSRGVTARDLGFKEVPGARSVGLVVLGLFGYGWSSLLWSRAVHPPAATSPFHRVGVQPVSVIVVAGLTAFVFAPVVEETFFRGFLYRSLRNRMSVIPAAVAAGAMFAAIHWEYPLLVRPELMFFGIIAALLYERTGSLLPGIAVHSLIDGSGFLIATTGSATFALAAYTLLAIVLLARPPLTGAARLLRGQRPVREYTAA